MTIGIGSYAENEFPPTIGHDQEDLLVTSGNYESEAKRPQRVPLDKRKEQFERLLRGLRNREIYTLAFRFWRFDLTGTDRKARQKEIIEIYETPEARYACLARVEAMCDLPYGSVIMYCSRDPQMNAKVAEVELLIDNKIKSFKTYEEEAGNEGLTGGALNAQIRRFEMLWSTQFYVQRNVWCKLSSNGKQDLEHLLRESFLPMNWQTGTADHHRKMLQIRVNTVREDMEKSFKAAAKSGTEIPVSEDFQGTLFPNGLPFDDPSDNS